MSSDDSSSMNGLQRVLAKWTPRSSSSEVDNEGGRTLENVVRTMFGSCTAFEPHEEEEEESMSLRPNRDRSSSGRRRESSSASARAQQAVHSLREKAEQRETSPSYRKTAVSIPFPATSSQRKPSSNQEVPYIVHEVGPPPPPPNMPGLGASSFDDGISAISAHTLEELYRQKSHKKPLRLNATQSVLTQAGFEASIKNTISNESSLFPPTTQSDREERDNIWEPIEFTREQSYNTYGSRHTFHSVSTESTDFENVWRQEEQKYWEKTVVKDNNKGTSRKKGTVRHLSIRSARDMRVHSLSRDLEMLALKQNGTNTTANSSAFSGMSSPHHPHPHPHDVVPLDPSDLIPISVRTPRRMARDPDRIHEFMAIDPYTEIGEI